jgi:hypothetical protein
MLLHPFKSELNWPLGEKEALDFTAPAGSRQQEGLRWLLPCHLLEAVCAAASPPAADDGGGGGGGSGPRDCWEARLALNTRWVGDPPFQEFPRHTNAWRSAPAAVAGLPAAASAQARCRWGRRRRRRWTGWRRRCGRGRGGACCS